jgi:hypothetical protein
MRKARYLLDRDLKEKLTSQSIDEHVFDLNLTSSSLYMQEVVTCIDHWYVTINLLGN